MHALTRLGFGFVETGTVTPRPQAGNPRPRLFRLGPDRAVINRMGFNNAGIEAYLARLARRPRGPVVLGANVGINKEGADPERDYPALIAAVAPHADYAVINVSSPNTPGLRDLQDQAQLRSDPACGGRARAEPPADAGEDRSRYWRRGAGGGGGNLRHRGRAGTDRVEHHDFPARRGCARRWRARPAACQGRRCSGSPPPYWRAPSCWRAAGSC